MTRGDEVWNVVGDEVHRNGRTLLTVNEWLTDEDAEEVCRLAAAAPMMLRALELVAQYTDKNQCSPYIARVMDAIRAAKGEDYDE